MKRAFILLLLTINCFFIYAQPPCFINIPDTIYHCGLSYDLPVFMTGGDWHAECPADKYVSVGVPVNNVYTFEFSSCGEYKIVYTEQECGKDSIILQIDNPSSTSYFSYNDSSFEYSGVSCPTGGVSCDNMVSVSGGIIPDPEWSICSQITCSFEHISSSIMDTLGICWAGEISFDTISGNGNTTMCWEGNQSAFIDIAQDGSIGNNYFDFVDSLNSSLIQLDLCPLPSEVCNIGTCEADSITYDTLYLPFPIHVGGKWHLLDDQDTIAMDTFTPFVKNGIDYLLFIEPSPFYAGPNSIDFTLFQLDGQDTIASSTAIELRIWWKELFVYDTIQRINTNYHYPDTTVCEGCGGFSYTSSFGAIPSVPDQPCSPISIGFGDACACGEQEFYVGGNNIIGCNSCAEVFVEGIDLDPQSITWSDGSIGFNASICQGGLVTVEAVDLNGCLLQGDIYIDENDTPPYLYLPQQLEINCEPVLLEPQVDNYTHSYYWTGPSGNYDPYDSFIMVDEPGIYTLTIINEFGCENTATIEVIQIEPLDISIEPTLQCINNEKYWDIVSTIISGGNGPFSYSLDGQNYQNNSSFTEVIPGAYILYVLQADGCENTYPLDLEVSEWELIEIIKENDITCNNACSSLSFDINSIVDNVVSFHWKLNNMEIGTSTEIEVCEEGSYELIIEDNFGCIFSMSKTVESFLDEPEIILTDKVFIQCEAISLEADVVSQGSINYVWQGPSITENTIYSPNPTIDEAGIYTVEVTDEFGCTSTNSIVVERIESIEAELISTKSCLNEDSGIIQILNISGGVKPYEVYLNGELINENNLIENLSADIYDVVIVDNMNCSAEYSIEVELIPFIDVISSMNEAYDLCENPTVRFNFNELINTIPTIQSIEWYDGSSEKERVFQSAGDYYLDIFTSCNTIRQEFTIQDSRLDIEKIFYIPNTFSPNNDGVNDEFQVFNQVPVSSFLLQVYDRWGSIVFMSRSIEESWDARMIDSFVKQGVYNYTLQATITNCRGEKQEINTIGDVTVIK